MKKICCLVIVSLLVCIGSTAAAAEKTGAPCDPKRIEQCCAKMDTLLASLDAMRAKVAKMQQELRQGREISGDQLEATIKQVEDIDRALKSNSLIWDY